MRVLIVSLFVFVACKDANPPLLGDAPVSCKADSDCNAPCGPCGSGDVIKTSDKNKECVVNPCPSAVALCAPDHTCRVR